MHPSETLAPTGTTPAGHAPRFDFCALVRTALLDTVVPPGYSLEEFRQVGYTGPDPLTAEWGTSLCDFPLDSMGLAVFVTNIEDRLRAHGVHIVINLDEMLGHEWTLDKVRHLVANQVMGVLGKIELRLKDHRSVTSSAGDEPTAIGNFALAV